MLDTVMRAVNTLKPHPKNARTHSKKQLKQLSRSIEKFGFVQPIVVDELGTILAGHARWAVAHMLGLSEVPVIVAAGLTETQKRAFVLADNKIAANAGWDREKLALELKDLVEILPLEFLDISITGFAPVEVDQVIADFEDVTADPADVVDPTWLITHPVTRTGDIWRLGKNRLMCGNARSVSDLDALMDGAQSALVFTDPPYNVKIKSVVGRGLGFRIIIEAALNTLHGCRLFLFNQESFGASDG